MITSAQIRMARAALKWSTGKLADKAGIGINTVQRIENGADARASTLSELQATLEKAGIEFIHENGGGPGVRIKKRGKK